MRKIAAEADVGAGAAQVESPARACRLAAAASVRRAESADQVRAT